MPNLDFLNNQNSDDATTEFLKCCGSRNWVEKMVDSRPFSSLDEMCSRAAEIWWSLNNADWLEAFRSHPKIGQKKAAVNISNQSQSWSSQEQAGVADAREQTIAELARLNREYEEKFGFIYIVCATAKSSEEMLEILKSRIDNQPDVELRIAAGEQAKITEIRLGKLVDAPKVRPEPGSDTL